MATSPRQFRIELYQEHLEEAGFLYDQCRNLRAREELSWSDVGDFEARLEAHLDALMVGAADALDVCRQRAVDGDASELFASLSIICRHGELSRLEEIVVAVDGDDESKAKAVTDALKYECPAEWHDHAVKAVEHADQRLAAGFATAIGYRRRRSHGALVRRLSKGEALLVRPLLWSIGRSHDEAALSAVRPYFGADDDRIASTACVAALRLQDQVAQHQVSLPSRRPCDAIAAGVAGGRDVVRGLLSSLQAAANQADVVMALGLSGELSAVRPLLELLPDEALAGPASEALTVITGSDILEEVFVADEIDEEELFPAELAAYKERGEVPRRLDGRPFGDVRRRPSRDRAAWEELLKSNARSFTAGLRYRWGQPCTPVVLLECLQSERFPKQYRSWMVDELRMRYGLDLRLETDMPVGHQQRVIERAIHTLRQQPGGFDPGRWYFAGVPIS